jgi:hypothetical protein
MKPMIGGIAVTAPLWNGATEDELRAIVRHLSDASHHYADDSGKEWGLGDAFKAIAAAEINRLKLGASAIRYIAKDQPQLVGIDDLLDAVLRNARKLQIRI